MKDVAVIGLGTMGATLARLLLSNGYRVTVWNRTIAKTDPLYGSIIADIAPSMGEFLKHEGVVIQAENYAVSESPLKQLKQPRLTLSFPRS